jgi:hypothetical protein
MLSTEELIDAGYLSSAGRLFVPSVRLPAEAVSLAGQYVAAVASCRVAVAAMLLGTGKLGGDTAYWVLGMGKGINRMADREMGPVGRDGPEAIGTLYDIIFRAEERLKHVDLDTLEAMAHSLSGPTEEHSQAILSSCRLVAEARSILAEADPDPKAW